MSWIASAIALSWITILAPLHLLHAQLLVDELAGDLLLQPIQHVLRHRQAGGQREQPGAVVDIGIADHVAIHHGDDPRRLRRRRRAAAADAANGRRAGCASNSRELRTMLRCRVMGHDLDLLSVRAL